MKEFIKNLSQNLARWQKIAIFVVLQTFVIIIIVTIVRISLNKNSVSIEIINQDAFIQDDKLPDYAISAVKDSVVSILKNSYYNIDTTNIENGVIREGTFEMDDDDKGAKFLLDVDSIQQTFDINVGWNEDGTAEAVANCPPIYESKYPESICYGAYNDTYSFWNYFPYTAKKPESSTGDGEYENNIIWHIEGDKDTNTIKIFSSVCDVAKYNAEALEYIKTKTPYYGNDAYLIEYITIEDDMVCD